MNDPWVIIISSLVGLLFTVAARAIDKYLPDPTQAHPIPPPPKPFKA